MFRPALAAATLVLLTACVDSAPKAPYTFVGTWDCDGSVTRFTNQGYSDATTSAEFFAVAPKGLGYELRFADGSLMALAAITETGMTWVLNPSGAQRHCRRL